MTFDEKTRLLIRKGEGSIPHMYLDTLGNVTVGVGQLLRTPEDALELPFVMRQMGALRTSSSRVWSGRRASDGEIRRDWEAVNDQQSGLTIVASAYKHYTRLELPEPEIDALLDRRIREFENDLKTRFSDYDDFPENIRLGLLDMAFNLGCHGLVTKFPTFTAAIIDRDWETAARGKSRQARGLVESRRCSKLSMLSALRCRARPSANAWG